MNNTRIYEFIIPLIFIACTLGYFIFVPENVKSLDFFIGYMSSLSTIVMVFVYLLTTRQQLTVMQKQLDEMQYSRNVESKPLLNIDEPSIDFDYPRYYTSPTTEFKKIRLLCRLFGRAKITNIGNGPAVAIDIIPNIIDREKNMVIKSFGQHIDLLSLKQGDTKDISILFFDEEHKIAEYLLNEKHFIIYIIILYKNIMGAVFKQEIQFRVSLDYDKIVEFKNCLKIFKTSDIDYGEQVKNFELLRRENKDKESDKILEVINNEIKNKFNNVERIKLPVSLITGSFKISPITNIEYEEILNSYKKSVSLLFKK